jgi:hypothetical protein
LRRRRRGHCGVHTTAAGSAQDLLERQAQDLPFTGASSCSGVGAAPRDEGWIQRLEYVHGAGFFRSYCWRSPCYLSALRFCRSTSPDLSPANLSPANLRTADHRTVDSSRPV